MDYFNNRNIIFLEENYQVIDEEKSRNIRENHNGKWKKHTMKRGHDRNKEKH